MDWTDQRLSEGTAINNQSNHELLRIEANGRRAGRRCAQLAHHPHDIGLAQLERPARVCRCYRSLGITGPTYEGSSGLDQAR